MKLAQMVINLHDKGPFLKAQNDEESTNHAFRSMPNPLQRNAERTLTKIATR